MIDPNRSMLWARVVVEELERSGVRAACISPGSRSAPLAFALAASGIRRFVHVDERSAAYFALGHARASGEPSALVCTSGTAAANYLPALVEASRSRVPLVVLTADRPHELRDTGANQTVDQVHLYGRHARWFADLPIPEPSDVALRGLRSTVCRAVAEARGRPAGPVHLNLPFRKPLEPTVVPGDLPADLARDALHGRADGRPYVAPSAPRSGPPSPAEAESAARILGDARRPLVVLGPRHARDALAEAAFALARVLGAPLLADPLSGARFAPGAAASALGAYDHLLAAGFEAGAPDVVVRFGAPPTSAALERWLERSREATHMVVDEVSGWSDPSHLATIRVAADAEAWCRAVASRVGAPRPPGAWLDSWRAAEATAWKVAESAFAGEMFEGVVAADVAAAVPAGGLLYVSNSLPVRDLDRFARPRDAPLRALGNRGASGIDGVVSSALGAAAAYESSDDLGLLGPLGALGAYALVGDLAFLHDLGGLLAARQVRDLTLVVVNNDGGGIFRLLPAAAYDPPFTEVVRAPHGLDLADAARLFGLPHVRVDDRAGLRQALAARASGVRVVEVASDAARSAERREAARAALRTALGG